jgi:peptide/nickel transport system substrate-binding protein
VAEGLASKAVDQIEDFQDVSRYEHAPTPAASPMSTRRGAARRLRVAVEPPAYAIDQESWSAVLGGPRRGSATHAVLQPRQPWYSQAVADAWAANDPARARDLLEEYTCDADRSDGRSRGEPVSFVFDCPPDAGLVELAQLHRAMWGAVGIEVDLRLVEGATHISEAFAGVYQAKCFRAVGEEDPYTIFYNSFTEGNPLNLPRFSHPDIDRNVEILRTSADLAERRAAVEAIGLVLAEQVPNTWSAGTLASLTAVDEVQNIDGSTFPDGTKGAGVSGGGTMWGQVWRFE